MSGPPRVLFVCTANISRSPCMELLTRHLAREAIEVGSAGTHGFAGRPIDVEMRDPVLSRGVAADLVAAFRSRPLTAELVAEADVVLTAEAAHRGFILGEQPDAVRKVFTLGQFTAAVREGHGETGGDLVRALAERRTPADPALDVVDPYRRGSEAAELCARQVETLLRVAVPALSGSGRITP